jgi:hypothetical protein
MALLVLPNNFKFKYFFGVQILVESLVPPILNSCDVSESSNTSEKRNIPYDFELHSFSPQIFDIDLNAMLQTVVIHVDDEFGLALKKPKKVVIDENCKFQEIWVVKMPWIKPIFNEVGMVSIIRCYVCIKIKRKEKILVVQWDFIEKHVGKRKGFNGKW